MWRQTISPSSPNGNCLPKTERYKLRLLRIGSVTYGIEVIGCVLVGIGDCLFVVAGHVVFTVSVSEGFADFTQTLNAHDIGSFNKSVQCRHSDLQSIPQFPIQQPLDRPS